MEFMRVGALAEIPEGEVRAYDTPTGRVAVAHVEAHVYAFGDECTHQGCSLAETGDVRRPRRHGGVRVPRQRLRRGAGRAARRSGGGSGSGVPGADRGRLGRGGGGARERRRTSPARAARRAPRSSCRARSPPRRRAAGARRRTSARPRRSRTMRRRPRARGRACDGPAISASDDETAACPEIHPWFPPISSRKATSSRSVPGRARPTYGLTTFART